MKKWIALFAVCTALLSCKKEPGVGGDAAIIGKVWVKDYNTTFTTLIGQYPGKDVYVYIVYGDHIGYDKRIKTDYLGQFAFNYLYPGNYKVYTYSVDSTFTDLSGSVAVVKEVTLDKRTEQKDLGEIVIFN